MNPGLTVADVVLLPNKKEAQWHANRITHDDKLLKEIQARSMQIGYDLCLSEISSLPLSNEKMVGMVNFDVEKLAQVIHQVKCKPLSQADRDLIKRIGVSGVTLAKAKEIISNKSKILSLKK